MSKDNPSPSTTTQQPNSEDLTVKNWNTVCRSCLCQLENEHFSMDETHLGRKVLDIYESVTCLKIKLLDALPKRLCRDCYKDIIKFDGFKNKAVESERLLMGVINANTEDIIVVFDEKAEDCDLDSCSADNRCDSDSNEDDKKPAPIEFLACDDLNKTKRARRATIKKPNRTKAKKKLCAECGKEVMSHRIDAHMRTHTKEKPFKCNLCNSTFADKSNLRRHAKIHVNFKPFMCELCGKDFIRPSSKAMHIATTHKHEKDVNCPICKKAFKHRVFVRQHMVKVHNKPEEVPEGIPTEYPCTRCDKTYKSKSSLYIHEKWHIEPRPFLCNTCGQSFTSKGAMQNHERIHTGELIYSCSFCGKKFRNFSTLKTHEMIHKGEKPLSCPYCNKQFRQHAHLKRHVRGQHDDQKPYICFCGSSFKQSSELRVHMRLHSNERLSRLNVLKSENGTGVDKNIESKSDPSDPLSLPNRTDNN